MTPGIHSLSYEQYAKAAGINASALKLLSPPSTPSHFKAAVIDRTTELDDTEALTFGVWAHRFLLEPDTIEGAYHVKPNGMNFATKEGKAWRAERQDKPIVEAQDVKRLIGIRDALWAHPTVKRLLYGAETERCLFAKDDHGTLRKARLDALTKGSAVPDLKTCERADEWSFGKAIANYGHYMSAPWYLDICRLAGIDKTVSVYICVEKEPPHAIALWSLPDGAIEYGRRCNERNLAVYRHCMETGDWPGYSPDIATIENYPKWLRAEMEMAA